MMCSRISARVAALPRNVLLELFQAMSDTSNEITANAAADQPALASPASLEAIADSTSAVCRVAAEDGTASEDPSGLTSPGGTDVCEDDDPDPSGFLMPTAVDIQPEQRAPPIQFMPPTGANILFRQSIGSGNYGTVHVVDVEVFKNSFCKLAAKICLNEARELEREMTILASKIPCHPSIVEFIGRFDDPTYGSGILFEFCARGSWTSYLRDERPGVAVKLRQSIEITNGVQHLMAHGVAHNDLKLDNILTRTDHSACIGDFGSALMIADDDGPIPHKMSDVTCNGYSRHICHLGENASLLVSDIRSENTEENTEENTAVDDGRVVVLSKAADMPGLLRTIAQAILDVDLQPDPKAFMDELWVEDPVLNRRKLYMLCEDRMDVEIDQAEAIGTPEADATAKILKIIKKTERETRRRRSSLHSFDGPESDAPEMIATFVAELTSIQSKLGSQ